MTTSGVHHRMLWWRVWRRVWLDGQQAEVVHVDSLEEPQHLAVIAVSAMET